MANRAYLLCVNDPAITVSVNPRHEVIAEGINELPIFWASLFSSGDTQVDRYSDGKRVRNWCVGRVDAIERLQQLNPVITRLLDRSAIAVWAKWVGFVPRLKATYLKVNASEVRDLDPKGYESYRRTLERMFSRPSARTINAAARRNGIEVTTRGFEWEGETTVCKLAGADHIRKLPWFTRRVVFPVIAAERRNVYDDIYDAVSPDDSLEDAVRKARMLLKKGMSRTQSSV